MESERVGELRESNEESFLGYFLKSLFKRESEKASFQARLLFFQSVSGGDKWRFR